MSDETPGNKYNKSSEREFGTDSSVRAYKTDTPGETPDGPTDALDQRYSVDNMYKTNKMPEPFTKQHQDINKKEEE